MQAGDTIYLRRPVRLIGGKIGFSLLVANIVTTGVHENKQSVVRYTIKDVVFNTEQGKDFIGPGTPPLEFYNNHEDEILRDTLYDSLERMVAENYIEML